MTATSTASQIPGLRRVSSQTVINRLRLTDHQGMRPERRNILTAHHLAERHRRRTVLFSVESHFILLRTD